jgi:hypothetical protein
MALALLSNSMLIMELSQERLHCMGDFVTEYKVAKLRFLINQYLKTYYEDTVL